jgi:predicted DNA-binding protein YlxM (UPF0122 family)
MNLIPGTKGFQADDKGNIYDSSGNLRTQYVNGDGYKTASVLLNDGRWVTFGVQRLVGLAFKPPVTEHLVLTVNHLDGDITNNAPPNLEWVTTQRNIVHGVLLNRFTNRPLIIAVKKSEEFYFDDLYEIAIYFKTDTESIWNCIRDEQLFDGWAIRHLKANDTWVRMNQRRKPDHISERIRAITMLDLVTKEETSFNSMNDVATHFNVKLPNIQQKISTPRFPKVYKGRYVFVDKGESFDFVNAGMVHHSQRTTAKKVIGYNTKNKVFEEFNSAREVLKKYPELSKKAVYVRLKNERLNETDGWIVKYISDLEADKAAIQRWLDLYYSR